MTRRITKQHLEKQLSLLDGEEAQAFGRKCRDWLCLESNKDGRGVKAKAIRKAHHACIWYRQAQRAARDNTDATVRHRAQKALRAALHHGFLEGHTKLRKLHGQISQAGTRAADHRRRDAERIIPLSHTYELREMRSMRSLQKVGRILGNCVAKKKYARSYLNNSDMETWALLEERQPMSLLTVDKDTRLVGEFEAAGGSVPKLKRSLAFKILNGLDINGDDDYAFAKVGAFYVFRHGTPAVSPIEIGDCQHNVWVVRDGAEIIIASKRSGERKKRWSRFSRHQSFVEAAWPSHLKEADLLGLLLDHPSFAERLSNRTANDEPATAPLEKNHV